MNLRVQLENVTRMVAAHCQEVQRFADWRQCKVCGGATCRRSNAARAATMLCVRRNAALGMVRQHRQLLAGRLDKQTAAGLGLHWRFTVCSQPDVGSKGMSVLRFLQAGGTNKPIIYAFHRNASYGAAQEARSSP